MHQLKNGMKKAKMQLAAKLLQNGSTIQYVADLTELPEETIRELAQNITSKKFFNTKSGNHTSVRDPVTKSQYDFRFCYSFNYSFSISQNTCSN